MACQIRLLWASSKERAPNSNRVRSDKLVGNDMDGTSPLSHGKDAAAHNLKYNIYSFLAGGLSALTRG